MPAKRDAQPMVPKVGGVVDAALTGWRASAAAKTYRNIGDALDATKGAVSSGIDLKRELDRLGDLDNILDEDQAQRDHARWEADRARKAARVQADYDDQLRVHRNEAELSQAKTDALYHQRRLRSGGGNAKSYRSSPPSTRSAPRPTAARSSILTAQEAARRRREQLAGGRAAPTFGRSRPDLFSDDRR